MNEEHESLDALMRDIMQADGLEQAPAQFTQNVMAQVQAEAATRHKPVRTLLPRWTWVGMAASFVVACAAAIMGGGTINPPRPGQQAAQAAMTGFMDWLGKFQVPSLLVLCAFAAMALYGLDRYMAQRR